MQIEKMTFDEIDSYVELYIEVFSKAPWYDVFESKKVVYDFIKNYFNNNYFLGYTLIENYQIIGLCFGSKKPYIKGMEYYIDQFCIKTEYQGRNCGSFFIKEIEKKCLAMGLKAIILNTEINMPALDFYKKNGFEELKELVFLAK